mgnify:FL=1
MEIKGSKTTLYAFDHPTKGYACTLRIEEPGKGYSWSLSDLFHCGKINIFAMTDSDGSMIKNIDHGGDGFSIKEDRDGLILMFNNERVYF